MRVDYYIVDASPYSYKLFIQSVAGRVSKLDLGGEGSNVGGFSPPVLGSCRCLDRLGKKDLTYVLWKQHPWIGHLVSG